jgi:hypothetical protein
MADVAFIGRGGSASQQKGRGWRPRRSPKPPAGPLSFQAFPLSLEPQCILGSEGGNPKIAQMTPEARRAMALLMMAGTILAAIGAALATWGWIMDTVAP